MRSRFRIDFRIVFSLKFDRFWCLLLRRFSIKVSVVFRYVFDRFCHRRRRPASIGRLLPNLNPYRPQWCFQRISRSRTSSIEGRNDRRRDQKTITGTIENHAKNRPKIDRKIDREVDRENDRKTERKSRSDRPREGRKIAPATLLSAPDTSQILLCVCPWLPDTLANRLQK